MAASGMKQDLAALEQARARLEAALASDESWRALRQSDGQDQAQESAARRARNTRLKMALAENPLYQAWKHLGEAIAALHETRAHSEAAAGRLPDDVTALLRDPDAEAVSQGAFGSLARRLEVSRPGTPGREPVRGTGPQAAGKSRAAPPPSTPRAGAQTADAPGAAPQAPPRGRAGHEADEATVTFVRREPLLPSVEQPPDLSAARAQGLFGRLRALADEPHTAQEAYSAPGRAEEAEVVIVSSESAQVRLEAEARAGTVRRLRKTLSGG